MGTRKETISSLKVCRFCLSESDTLTSLYEKYRAPRNTVTLPLKILSCVSIEVFPSDKMPTYICNRCKFFMDISYDFKHICRQADEHILQHLQNGIPLSPLNWPQSLLKLFRLANKSTEVAVMKTVIEGGATVQVTAQESDSDEEDDENVFNVKIGDGSDEGSKSARVKVITSADKQDKGKPKRAKDAEEQTLNEFPLQQKIDVHTSPTHEQPNVQCTKCEAKFFTRLDMLKHKRSHRKIVYQCICGKKYKRLMMLKKHKEIIHADLFINVCKYCPAMFNTSNELEYHENQKHAREQECECKSCFERFSDKPDLRKHVRTMHKRKWLCSYKNCTSLFPSVAKLSRHVERTHPGERSYSCKYCNKSFIKSHHLTRHLRLKHRETIRTCRGPFGETDQFRCNQCEDSFATQDELIYHSAIHATQNLICPLCEEKFEDVDAVTAHIKSHSTGREFMCDLCELVFTSNEKLENHIKAAHDDELLTLPDIIQDESSFDMDVDDEEDDNEINVKEEDDHMVVEIKKATDFMLSNTRRDTEEKLDNTNSEDSESEMTYTDIAPVELESIGKDTEKVSLVKKPITMIGGDAIIKAINAPPKTMDKVEIQQTASILRKAEEVKKKVIQQPAPEPIAEKKDKNEKMNNNKSENNSNIVGASDKSLRLLEKDLQELKRTNIRSEAVKTPAKPVENLRSRRAQIHTSTPKLRSTPIEEKKAQIITKSPAVEKKLPERRVFTKENKEPKESKEAKTNNVIVKDDKEREVRENKDKDVKENKENKEREVKETLKHEVKNGSNDKSNSEETNIRRSTRPSKIKDYAKMIRDRSQDSDDNDESDDNDDEEYKEVEKIVEVKTRTRRSSVKTPTPKQAPAATPRKRGRPRKEPVVAPKVRKEEIEDNDEETSENIDTEKDIKLKTAAVAEKEQDKNISETVEDPTSSEQKPSSVLVSPSGQTLKKIPIKALPPGVKPMPLPINARPMAGEVVEMQIGKKVVKVQKIVMTKAEVEAMTKKGLVEMKDGTMVLKQGIKIPTSDSGSPKINPVVEDAGKESPCKNATPSRCDFEEE